MTHQIDIHSHRNYEVTNPTCLTILTGEYWNPLVKPGHPFIFSQASKLPPHPAPAAVSAVPPAKPTAPPVVAGGYGVPQQDPVVGSNYVRKHPIKEWIRTLKKTRVCETTYSTAASSSWCSVVISALRKVHEWVERERMGVNLLPRRANSKPHESMSKTWNLASKS